MLLVICLTASLYASLELGRLVALYWGTYGVLGYFPVELGFIGVGLIGQVWAIKRMVWNKR